MRTALTAQVALATAGGGLAAGLLASWAAESTTDLRAGVAVRAVTVLALLAAVPYLLVRRHVLDDRRGPLLAAGVLGTALGYAANPMAWDGRAFFTQLITPPGALTATLDLLGWVSVGALAVVAASRSAASHGEPVGYGT